MEIYIYVNDHWVISRCGNSAIGLIFRNYGTCFNGIESLNISFYNNMWNKGKTYHQFYMWNIDARRDFLAVDPLITSRTELFVNQRIIIVANRERVSNPNFRTKLILGQVLLPLSYSASPINIGSMNCLYVYVITDLML